MIILRRDALHVGRCTEGSPHASGIASTRATLLLVLIGLVALVSSSRAQNNPPRQFENSPPRPFQETAPGLVEGAPGVVTPQRITDEIEAWAKKRDESNGTPVERTFDFTIFHADSTAEFTALARYSLLILTVVTQKPEELPLKRVYLRTADWEIPLLKISSWRRNIDQTLLTYKMYGPYREDGFYLFPTSAYLRVAQLQADFAANRSDLPLLELPAQLGPKWLRTLQNPDPVPNALPNLKALQAFIKRRTSGFPIPDSLPQAALAKAPFPESLPQAAEPKKPGSLRELFNR